MTFDAKIHTRTYHFFHPTCACLNKNEKIGAVALNCLLGLTTVGTVHLAYYGWAYFHNKPEQSDPNSQIDTRLMEICFDKSQLGTTSRTKLPDDLEREFEASGAKETTPYYRKKYIEWKNSQHQDAHHWIKFLDDRTTFPTRVLNMSLEQGIALRDLYQHRVNQKAKLNEKAIVALSKLQNEIDHAIQEFGSDNTGVFVRLSTRSPKDALYYPGTDNYEQMVRLLRTRVNELQDDPDLTAREKANQELIIFTETMTQALQVHSGKAAIDLLANSERILTDLNRALDFPNLWDMKLIVRLFQPVPYSMEFRGFVYNGKLTALSQYDPYIYFSELNNPRIQRKIIDRIESFFYDQIKDRIPLEHYIVDFGIRNLNQKSETEVLVIEINSFEPSTGSGLFSWENDRDVLRGDSENIILRVVTSIEDAEPCPFNEVIELLDEIKRD